MVLLHKIATDLKRFFSQISIDCLAVCLYFVCMPFTMVSTPFGSLLKVITMPVVALLAIKLFVGKTKLLQFNIVHFVYGAYVIFCFAQLFYFRESVATVTTSDIGQSYLVILLITLRVYNKNEQSLIETIWIIVGITCVILCLTSKNVISEYESRTVVRILGYEEDPNQYAAYFTMAVVVAMKRIIDKSKLSVAYIGLLLLILYSVLKMGSRGGLIGIVAAIATCMIFGARDAKSRFSMLIIGAIGVVLIITVFIPLLPENVQSRFTMENVVGTGGAGRTDIWKFCIRYIFEKPERIIFGSGLLSTEVIFPTLSEVTNVVAHNQFIQSFFDQGIIGLSLYLASLSACVLRNIKKKPFYACAMLAIIAFSMSLTMYVLKPYINVLMMCSLNIDENEIKNQFTSLTERSVKE